MYAVCYQLCEANAVAYVTLESAIIQLCILTETDFWRTCETYFRLNFIAVLSREQTEHMIRITHANFFLAEFGMTNKVIIL